MKKGIVTTISFVLFLAIFSLGTWLLPPREFSENENRYLAGMPHFRDGFGQRLSETAKGSAKASVDLFDEEIGGITSGLKTYATDQVFLRDFLVSLKSTAEKFTGTKESNGAFLAKDGYYIQKLPQSDVDEENFNKNIKAVESMFQKYEEILGREHLSFVLAPTAAGVLENKLSRGHGNYNQRELLERAKNTVKSGTFVDLYTDFKASSEQLYYKTDHHWTTRGAYLAYTNLMKQTGKAPKQYHVETLTDSFRGTLYSKAPYFGAPRDTVELFKLENESKLSLTVEGKKADFNIYDRSKAKVKDAYTAFFGGNYAEMTVTNPNGKGHLLVLKDSYANCFLPFLVEDYATVTVLDLRWPKKLVSSIVREKGITDIMVLYNLDTFIADEKVPFMQF